jgi:hypothetical protein
VAELRQTGLDATKELADGVESKEDSKFQQYGTDDENRKSVKSILEGPFRRCKRRSCRSLSLIIPTLKPLDIPEPGLKLMLVERGFIHGCISPRAVLAGETSDTDISGARLRVCCVIEVTIPLCPSKQKRGRTCAHQVSVLLPIRG